jgi:hypothetical protein
LKVFWGVTGFFYDEAFPHTFCVQDLLLLADENSVDVETMDRKAQILAGCLDAVLA